MKLQVLHDQKGNIISVGQLNENTDGSPRAYPRPVKGQSVTELEVEGDDVLRALHEIHERFTIDCAGATPRLVAKEGKGGSTRR